MMTNWLFDLLTTLWQNGTVSLLIGWIIIGYGAGWVIKGTELGRDYGQVVFRIATKTEDGKAMLNTGIHWDGVPTDPKKPSRFVFRHHRLALGAFERTVRELNALNGYDNAERKQVNDETD